jgi:hypothetical protein
MSDPGRPTLYRSDYCELARNYCLLGATNDDLAAFFDVTSRTIDNWIATKPEFASAVRKAKAMADARVARCLYQRAVGYQHTVERTVLHQGRERKVVNQVHLPPDTRACIFWLRNRQPRRWSSRPETPPEDDGVDIARLEAASEAVRHAPIPAPSDFAVDEEAPPDNAAQSLGSAGASHSGEDGDAAPTDDGIGSPPAGSKPPPAGGSRGPPGGLMAGLASQKCAPISIDSRLWQGFTARDAQ